VLAWCDRRIGRRSQYSGPGALRLCSRLRALGTALAVLGGFAAAGCSFQLKSLLAKDNGDVEASGSISRPAARPKRTADAAPASEADLAYARAAASDALAHSGKDQSVPWQNPNTGAGGNITPLETSYTEGGQRCRDFLASYVRGSAQEWLQGTACHVSQGNWEVKSLKPLKRS
jgi:surface antigen